MGLLAGLSMGAVYPRHRLDVGWWVLFWGLMACVLVWRRGLLSGRVLRAFGAEGDGLVCLSVRTGWDLYLRALGLREGDEVLVSAITHPDMARIARGHGLRVVPVDVDPRTLAPRVEDLRAALTGRTRVVVVAHLFGGRVDLCPVARFAEAWGLLLVEDCAQAFVGTYRPGHPEADASLYSFGTLKTATALGGAVLRVKNARMLDRMRRIEARYPVRGRARYATRLCLALLLLGLGDPRFYGALFRTSTGRDSGVVGLLGRATRSFPATTTAELFRGVRGRPSLPLLAVLGLRLERFDRGALAARAAAGAQLSAMLKPRVEQPGSGCAGRTHWLFPVVVRDPEGFVRGLRRRGFDASRATSSITALRRFRERAACPKAERVMTGIVFLPAYPTMPEKERDRLASAVNELAAPELAFDPAPL